MYKNTLKLATNIIIYYTYNGDIMKKDKKKFKIIEKTRNKTKLFGILEFKKMTKKEQEIEKKVSKLSKTTKTVGFTLLFYIIFSLINNVIMSFSESYTLFYVKHISNFKNGIFYFLFGHIKAFNFVLIIVTILVYMFFVLKAANTKNEIKKRNKAMNTAYIVLFVFLYFGALSFLIDNQYYAHIPNFDTILFEEAKNKTYTKEDLEKLSIYLKDKVYESAINVPRNEKNEIVTNDLNYNKQAIKDLHNISDTIPLLKGLYPTKSTHIGDTLKGFYGSSTAGLTNNYTTYFDYDQSPTAILNTITHEYCHTKGITRENETVFCSVLAGIKSNNIISNYAGYLEAFGRVNEAYSYFNPEHASSIENDILHLCLTNNYEELCDIYTKNNNSFIPGTEQMHIYSYKLKYYKNFTNELTTSLETLRKQNAKFKVNNEQKTIEEIINLVNENSEYSLSIELKLDNKIFNEIKSAIENDNFYLVIYQEDLDEEQPPAIEKPKEFFLEPFPTNDEGIFNGPSYAAEDYTYERSARLFLEYFEENGYK